jgi:hydroxysqualene synthase
MGEVMDSRHLGLPVPIAEPRRLLRRHSSESSIRLQDSYDFCLATARSHDDDFPVASRILPEHLRKPVAVIHAFARTAHDLADGAHLNPGERLTYLAAYEAKLDIVKAGGCLYEPIFLALADVIRRHALPLPSFYELLDGARLNALKRRYASFAELADYCRHAANPVGRLLLHLYRSATPRNLGYADALCTALQLIHLLQNLGEDYHDKGRIYLPQDEMGRFGVCERHFAERCSDEGLRRLIEFQVLRARRLLQGGAPLGRLLHGRVGLHMRLVIVHGVRVLDLLKTRKDVFAPPHMGRLDWASVIWHALFRPYPS